MDTFRKYTTRCVVVALATALCGTAAATTKITYRSHSIAAGASAGNLEGRACETGYTMISGSCHPGYTDQVRIINQYPNRGNKAWRCGFQNLSGSSRTVWIYTLCDKVESGGITHQVQVRRYTTSSLTNARADQILADSSTILQTNDGTGDVACATTWLRNGNVTAFSTGDGSIDSSGEFNTIIGLPGQIKVVNAINWCGGLIPNVIGCAPVPGNSLAVVRYMNSLEGILWAHEYGHNKGLGHRNDVNAIMNGTIGSSHRRVNTTECNAYRTLPGTGAASSGEIVLAQYNGAQPTENDGQTAGVGMDVTAFVRQVYIHGVPYEEATRFGAESIPVLVEMLNDTAAKPYWANVVVVLGMIGDPQALDPLISFIEKPNAGTVERELYTAKTSAIMSLGYIINKSGNNQALAYLKRRVDPQSWEGSNVGRAAFQASTSERDLDFSKYAVLGLALSGNSQAAEILRELRDSPATTGEKALQAQMADVLSAALDENAEIARKGLVEYYKNKQ